ncbi:MULTISPECIES: DUF3551 domain-containing protein [Rhodopseudomonas]|nr:MULTISPECIES: DUF3551 domain-containing protein [Rhodopseudomonas]MDF3811798.1 DUF3551 domain-containing protein [Rhodopseudomonas sp. BAL398]WOK20268.1 DUF3551 domain-containing protein [Rhodopseudomonas sp. BAL398]
MIRSYLPLLAIAATLFAVTPGPASAHDYAYCLQGRTWGYPGNCAFTSYAQCMATASGTTADCGINPRVAFGIQDSRWRHARRGDYYDRHREAF